MNIYILGGGCFGAQYARWLAAGRERGKVSFDRLVIVDKDPDCAAASKIKEPFVHIETSDWVDFLKNYTEQTPRTTKDLIVPSHAAPHLLGKTFFDLIKSQLPLPLRERVGVRGIDISTPIGAPFEKRLEKGLIAVSMATWNCPANCPEPGKCPHIHAPRDWDLELMLRDWAKKAGLDEFFVFPARHFAFAVSGIPSRIIIDSWQILKTRLSTPGNYLVGVSTASACHGIISLFNVTVKP
jgi:hypothetical protein